MNVLLLRDVVAILLAGGAGERLYPLTRERAKPAVPFGGPYRIVDFTLSNCINSGLRKIFIATQYKAQSLNRHVRMGWNVVNRELGEFIEILPPQKRMGEHWYLGTADAVWQNLYAHRAGAAALGDRAGRRPHLQDGLRQDAGRPHRPRGAPDGGRHRGARSPRPAATASSRWTPTRRVVGLPGEARGGPRRAVEPRQLPRARWASTSSTSDVLVRELRRDAEADSTHDFGRDIIPRLVGAGERVFAYLFWDENKKESQYWRDVGTIDAYFEASMDLIQVDPVFNLYDPDWPLRTYQPQLPPAKFVFAEDGRRGVATQSIVSMGCIVSGSEVRRSILCPDVRVHSFCDIEDSILLPDAVVHRHSRIRRAIVDRGVELPRGARIGHDPSEDRRRHTVSEGGVVVVTPGEECLVDPQFS